MIEISDHDYRRLLDGRNALRRQVSASEAANSNTNDATRTTELAEAVKQAQTVLAQYGEHQTFVLL
ncbi:hypothetical protein [Caballeronia sp. dw_276]|uniref:hypothetical protein n=1 Tax=Caballeronia sp. dw_276 TaxID=2719795 RepID=UPI001BD3C84C|nr:hypothetical protein [Caballeronia sp. dw_276]